MKFKTNLAYSKSNSQRVQQNRIYKNSHIGRIYRSKVQVQLKFYIFSIMASAAFLSVFILSLVKRNEINASLNSLTKELQIQTSENIRLKTQVEQLMNIHEIEHLASKRGMKRLDNNQIIYIKTPSRKKEIVSHCNVQVKTSPLSKLFNKFKKLFGVES